MNNKLWQSLVNAWKLPELRAKVLFTAAMITIYRFGAHVPVPGIDLEKLKGEKRSEQCHASTAWLQESRGPGDIRGAFWRG